ncbi:MAG: hypothetical protein C0444_03780 [Microbacterium sp.]|nr:hypothetical protein [Microbacterium sp.]MBA4345260.1 hypothetical protein [Microbacterium sp.]
MDLTAAGNILAPIFWAVTWGGLAAFWVAAMVSISRRSAAMSGVELLGWYALVIFAQVIGTMIWFFVGRDRYAPPPSRQ